MYGACRGSESHHDSPQQPKVQGCRSGSPVEVFAEHLPDDSVWIVAKNATSLATPDSKSRNSLLRSFKSVAESLFERLRQSGGSECNDELETGMEHTVVDRCETTTVSTRLFHFAEGAVCS